MTVQVDVCPLVKEPGVQVRLDTETETAFNKNVLETELAVAVKVALVFAETFATVAVKFALVLPAGTVTLLGTVMLPLLLDKATGRFEDGAPLMLTVQDDVAGAFTVPGVHDNAVGVTVG
ncbi:MAG: hypothetical protein WDO18_12580 [Acidobacteriota bacterium]